MKLRLFRDKRLHLSRQKSGKAHALETEKAISCDEYLNDVVEMRGVICLQTQKGIIKATSSRPS